MARVKKVFIYLMVAFVVYAVITSPTQAADIVRTAWDIILDGFAAIGTFFNSLLGR